MRQKGRQETSGKESHRFWGPLSAVLTGAAYRPQRELKRGLEMIIFKGIKNTKAVGKPVFQW